MPIANPISNKFLQMRHERTFSLLDGKNPESILDVGCGSGEFLSIFAKRFPFANICGCDLLRKEVENAKKACPRGEFYCGNFMELEFEPAEVVAMLEVLEHSNEPAEMLKKGASLAGKNGHVLVSIPRPEVPYWNVIWWAWSNTLGRKWRGQHSRLREAELDLLASGYGLVKEKRKRFFLGCISMTLYRVGKE